MLHSATSTFYYLNDHLGTPQLLLDRNGRVVWQGDYHPFGRVDPGITTRDSDLRFPGQRYDQETGLHYNAMRYYDPNLGRYITPDPIGLAGGMNPYIYTGGDPVDWSDPWGLNAAVAVIPPPTIGGNQTGTLTPGQWSDMRNFLGLFDPRPILNWMMNENTEDGGEQCDVPTTPPDGLVENPHRPGSWGEIGSDGKFKEKWRRDKGRPEIKSGHGAQDHIHVGDRWYPIKKK